MAGYNPLLTRPDVLDSNGLLGGQGQDWTTALSGTGMSDAQLKQLWDTRFSQNPIARVLDPTRSVPSDLWSRNDRNAVMAQAAQIANFGGTFAGENALFKSAEDKAAQPWFTGVDDKAKFEIPDVQSKFIGFDRAHKDLLSSGALPPGSPISKTEQIVAKNGLAGTLNEFIDHPELFERYPWLREYPVGIRRNDAMPPDIYGEHYPGLGIILNGQRRNPDQVVKFANGTSSVVPGTSRQATPDELHSTLLHEVQHAIQDHEGFATGGNPEHSNAVLRNIAYDLQSQAAQFPIGHIDRDRLYDEANNIYDLIYRDPHAGYRNLAGEVEARNVQARNAAAMQMVAQGSHPEIVADYLRKMGQYPNSGRHPLNTMDIPASKQFILPVEHNPFAPASASNPHPVEHDPFASAPKATFTMTPAETRYMQDIFNNSANRAELHERVPSADLKGNTVTYNPAHHNALVDWLDQSATFKGEGRFPPSFYNGSFTNRMKLP